MAKRIKLNIGDIFSIPINENEVGIGQIISEHDSLSGGFIIAIYPFRTNKNDLIDSTEVVNSQPLFLGYTFDSLIKVLPKWKIIENYKDNLIKIKFPYHKILSNGKMVLENHKEEKVALITETIFNKLSNKTELAPIRYENALKAYFGLQEWKDDYDELLYQNSLKSNEIANEILMAKK